jgi:hypothetical protein
LEAIDFPLRESLRLAAAMRKQLDNRIPILINNNVKKNHRSFIVLVGDKGRDQVHPVMAGCGENL